MSGLLLSFINVTGFLLLFFFFFNLVDQMSGLKTYGKIGGKLVESARIIDPKIDAKCRNKVDGGGGGVDSENWFDLTEN